MPRKSLAQEERIANGIVFGARERRKPLEGRVRRENYTTRGLPSFPFPARSSALGSTLLPSPGRWYKK
jgi:hypothetical protein